MMPAAKHLDPLLGIDIHIIQPPGPVPPVPIPHPHIGMVLDPMDYVPYIGGTVTVGGLQRAQAGTSGLSFPHFPIGGIFVKPPGNESEIFMGSSTVCVDGDAFSYLALPVLSCHDIGMPGPPRPKGSPPRSLVLPTTVVLAIPMPVLVGGSPTISLMALGMRVGMAALRKGLGKLKKLAKKSKKAKALAKRMHRAAKKAMTKLGVPPSIQRRVHRTICSITGHPVDVATGNVFTTAVDLELAGPLPLKFEREWYSSDHYAGPLGHGWHHSFDLALIEDEEAVAIRLADGRGLAFPPLRAGESAFDRRSRMTLHRGPSGYRLSDVEGMTHHFRPAERGQVQPLQALEDRSGHRVTFAHDPRGALCQIVDSSGRVLELARDHEGRITAITGPAPDGAARRVTLVRYGYDARGDLVEVIDGAGARWSYAYENHLMVRETNGNDLSFQFEYDGEQPGARCIRTWGDGGIYDHRLRYEGGGITLVEDSRGHVMTYIHRAGLVRKTVDPLGGEHVTQYNDFDQLDAEIDPLGRATRWEYDERGNTTTIHLPNGVSTKFELEQDLLVRAVDANGATWTWTRDERGRVIERSDGGGNLTRWHYQGAWLTAMSDGEHRTTQLGYDQAGMLCELRTPDGTVSRWSYDALGRMTEHVDPAGNRERYQHDLGGRLTQLWEPDGNVRSFSYDALGKVVRATDAQHDVAFGYWGLGKLASRTEGGASVIYRYDTEGELVEVVNELGGAHRFELDPLGRVVAEIGFDGLRHGYEYDLAGQLVRVELPSGASSELSYGNAGLVTEIRDSDGGFRRFAYRGDGQPIEASNEACTVRWEFDASGRPVREFQDERWVDSRYDGSGLCIGLGSSFGVEQSFERGAGGEVIGLSCRAREATGDPLWSATLRRDLLGAEVERLMPGGVQSRWARDALGRPTQHRIWGGSALVRDNRYQWAHDDRLVRSAEAVAGVELQFGHDVHGNLAWASGGGSTQVRMPDLVGNLYRRTDRGDRRYGPAGQLIEAATEVGTHRYRYDTDGQLVEWTEHDGRLWQFAWRVSGQLASITRPDGERIELSYDALGRRIAKTSAGVTTRWLWDGQTPLHEWCEGGAVDAEPITWIFDPGTFTPTAKLVGTQAYSIVSNEIGVPLAMFDEQGVRVWAGELDIYGHLSVTEGEPGACPFRWAGQYEDVETGLYYNRHRYYDPRAGVYISPDPLGIEGGRALYAYPLDPLVGVDPLGLNVSSGKGRDHVTYRGVKNGKPYTGYASAPSSAGLTPDEIVSRRYGGDFTQFGGDAPDPVYNGSGATGKHTARGLEQHYFEQDVKTHGRTKVANRQNPVGATNPRRTKYRAAAKKHLKGCS